MNKSVEGKYQVTISLPDALYMPVWQEYARIGREHAGEDNVTANFLKARAVIESGSYTGADGVERDVKTTAIAEIPPAVVAWVGSTVLVYVNEQFAIEKNSSAPSSGRQPPASTSG